MSIRICKKVCNECPFSKTSLRGFLGGFTIDETLNAMQFDRLFSCHLQRTDETSIGSILEGKEAVCRGFMLSAKKSCKLFGQANDVQSIALKLAQENFEFDKEELNLILSKHEFRQHHDNTRRND